MNTEVDANLLLMEGGVMPMLLALCKIYRGGGANCE